MHVHVVDHAGSLLHIDPLQLQHYFPALDVPEAQDHVLDELAVLPAHAALLGEAVPAARRDRPHHGAVADALGVQFQDLRKGQHLDVRVPHWVVLAEGVLVKHRLYSTAHHTTAQFSST